MAGRHDGPRRSPTSSSSTTRPRTSTCSAACCATRLPRARRDLAAGGRSPPRAERPDLVMLDVDMPEMNGYEVCRELKRDDGDRDAAGHLHQRARRRASTRCAAFEAGGADYVTKPFEFGEVLARIENQLKIARLQRELEAAQRRAGAHERGAAAIAARARRGCSARCPTCCRARCSTGSTASRAKIGSGGFGTVFRATQIDLDRPVAVKIFQSLAGTAHVRRARAIPGAKGSPHAA